MKLYNVPFNGLFIVYKRENGEDKKLCYGFEPADIPLEYREMIIDNLYAFDDSIIVYVK